MANPIRPVNFQSPCEHLPDCLQCSSVVGGLAASIIGCVTCNPLMASLGGCTALSGGAGIAMRAVRGDDITTKQNLLLRQLTFLKASIATIAELTKSNKAQKIKILQLKEQIAKLFEDIGHITQENAILLQEKESQIKSLDQEVQSLRSAQVLAEFWKPSRIENQKTILVAP